MAATANQSNPPDYQRSRAYIAKHFSATLAKERLDRVPENSMNVLPTNAEERIFLF